MAELEKLREQLNRIEEKLTAQKSVLNLDEAATFLGISKSHLYKLTSTGGIPCYSPGGKKLYFNRSELEKWALESDEGLTN
jgi:excisionase family DNA binding protein